VLRRTFRLTRQEEIRERKIVDDDELHTSYSSPNIIPVIKSRGVKGAGHVEHM
jgi:hypothetical protein